MDTRRITLAITTFNRFDLTLKSFAQVLDDERISEIILVDDNSSFKYYQDLVFALYDKPKIKLHRNQHNLGVYHNKRRSVELSTNEWVIVGDSDNIYGPAYLDAIYAIPEWDTKTEYCPGKALPAFNYTHLADNEINRHNINNFWSRPQFGAFINTMNSFFNREEYLKVWDGGIEPISSDSIYMNYLWLSAGNKIRVLPDMEYQHLIHKGSHYNLNCAKSNVIHKRIMEQLKMLR